MLLIYNITFAPKIYIDYMPLIVQSVSGVKFYATSLMQSCKDELKLGIYQ